ncbi:glycosyltransferase [Alsobacter sp. R-9]
MSVRRPSICIVTPGALGSNPRVVKEADALAEEDFDVRVVSTRTLDLVDARDEAVLRRARWTSERIDLRSRLAWRALRLPQLLAARIYRHAPLPQLRSPALHPASGLLAAAARRQRADLYIGHYPAALPAVAAAAALHGTRFAYDAEDFHLGDWPDDPAFEAQRALLRDVEGALLRHAAYVTAASPMIADAYKEEYGIAKPAVILNVVPLAQGPISPTDHGSARPAPSVYWVSQTVGPSRGLEAALRAVALSRVRPHLYLRGSPAEGFAAALLELAKSSGVGHHLHFLPPAPPHALEGLAADYDIGLCSEPGHTRNNLKALSNKLFSFLVAGLPPLMSDTPAQSAFARDAGLVDCLYRMEDPASLATKFDEMLGISGALESARRRAWSLGQTRYNWEVESRALVDLARAAIGPAVVGMGKATALISDPVGPY